MKKVRICCVQYELRKITNFREFAQQCEYFTDVASNYKSDFVMFPELFTTQLLSFEETKRCQPGEQRTFINKYTEEYIALFSKLSLEYNINIIAGTHLQD